MRGWALAAAVLLGGCVHRVAPPPAAPAPHYVVGGAYRLGAAWRYPREQFRYEASGLATRLPAGDGLTADGEVASGSGMTGAHPTLQLPAIVDVTNLETGRQVRLRLNDRGPAQPGRLLGLSARAADLLGVPAGAAVQVRIELDSPASQALRDRLGGGPAGVVAAPVAAVVAEALPPPGQAARGSRVVMPPAAAASGTAPAATLAPLPETVRVVPAVPGQLWIRAGEFTQTRYANLLRSRLSFLPTVVRRETASGAIGFVVLAGPFASVADADSALDQALAAGVTDASIVVE